MMWWIWVLLAIAVVLMFVPLWNRQTSETSRSSSAAPGKPSAKEILEQRYARGEIDSEEFEEKNRVLERDVQ